MIATVVTWTSGDGADIALSFENDLGCHDFWYIFLSLSSSNRDRVEMCKFLDRSPDFIPSDEEERANHSQMIPEPSAPRSRPSISLSLPEKVEIETIPDIDHILEKALDASAETRRGICTAILEASHISKLLDLFRVAEDLQSRPTLYRLYSIFKNLLNFNNNAILEELFSEKNIFNVAGVFEYDPAYPETRSDYRQYLTDRNRFKQILDFSDNPYLLRSIHQTFRLQFLKDVVLPRILSEETFNSLLFMVRCNFVEIIDSLDQDPQFLSKLEPLFLSEEETECESTLKFMKEFLSIAKSSADDRNLRIYQGESFKTSLGFLQRMLSGTSLPCQILATDILITISQYDSNMIKQLMLESKSMPMEQQLLVAMIDRFGDASTKIGLRWQLVAILRTLLGSSWAVGLPASNDEFLNSFYPDYALRLLNPLVELDKRLSSSDKETPLLFSQQEADLYFNCCELLCSFIIQHKYRIKYLLFRSFIIHNMLLLLNCQNKYLRLCPIRVIRTMIGTGDDFYFRFFIKQTIFKPLLEEAIALAAADNALTSALSELFIFIKEKKYKLLIFHLVETFRRDLEAIKFAPIFKELEAVYNELLALNSEGSTVTSDETALRDDDQKYRDTWLGVDKSEEAYFSGATDDDDVEEDYEHQDEAHHLDDHEKTDYMLPKMGDSPVKSEGEELPFATLDEPDMAHRMAATWQEDLDRNKRLKY